jgi:hypothetical protein
LNVTCSPHDIAEKIAHLRVKQHSLTSIVQWSLMYSLS